MILIKSILARAFRDGPGTNDPGEESALELIKTVLTFEIIRKAGCAYCEAEK